MHEICDMATLADGGRIRTRRIYNLQPELSLVQRQADRCVNIAIRDEPERLHLDGADLFGCLGEYALFLCAESVGLFSESCAGLLTGTPSFVENSVGRKSPRSARAKILQLRRGPFRTIVNPHHAYATPFTQRDNCPRPPGHSFPRRTNPPARSRSCAWNR